MHRLPGLAALAAAALSLAAGFLPFDTGGSRYGSTAYFRPRAPFDFGIWGMLEPALVIALVLSAAAIFLTTTNVRLRRVAIGGSWALGIVEIFGWAGVAGFASTADQRYDSFGVAPVAGIAAAALMLVAGLAAAAGIPIGVDPTRAPRRRLVNVSAYLGAAGALLGSFVPYDTGGSEGASASILSVGYDFGAAYYWSALEAGAIVLMFAIVLNGLKAGARYEVLGGGLLATGLICFVYFLFYFGYTATGDPTYYSVGSGALIGMAGGVAAVVGGGVTLALGDVER